MARYIGPKCKLSRREGTDLFLKSARRSLDSKCKLDTKPGQHGVRSGSAHVRLRRAAAREAEARRMYGMLERQFRRYFAEADARQGLTGANLLKLLESRLDNVVYRMGLGSTRAEARQLVTHRAITVNGKVAERALGAAQGGRRDRVRRRRPNAAPDPGSAAARREGRLPVVGGGRSEEGTGTFKGAPDRSEFGQDINESLVVELYSKISEMTARHAPDNGAIDSATRSRSACSAIGRL